MPSAYLAGGFALPVGYSVTVMLPHCATHCLRLVGAH